ncbi:beta-propeller fold lactonase family protein [Dactylosporangium sp. AC04546]|uniref:lactonase family protein n=1 Tax=Dactylosporangium sp. AC04546 TaxID=2862460 RepID=UPI001EDD5EC8|nr:beta-propeller fold lactonase family protein [Dactylosporangium sp. AC04546]WVK79515.1 beta-propeller fold lactonase family protein [Dactylosporangium sp. AC04546]
MGKARSAFYAGIAPGLVQYEIDPQSHTLTKKSEFELPLIVQYAWPDPDRAILYVGASNRDTERPVHRAYALKIAETGALSQLGDPVTLPYRPVHVTVDSAAQHFLVAFNRPSELAVIRVNPDGSLGEFVEQSPDVDSGIFPHQIRVTPDNRYAISVARGNPAEFGWWAQKGPQRDPGGLSVFEYKDGALGARTQVTVGDGYSFGPRHLDFHPTGPWVYVSLETQNEVVVYRRDDAGIQPEPLQRLSTLENPDDVLLHHGLGTVHMHPNGRTVYFANRSHKPVPQRNGTSLILGGQQDNSLVVYAIDEQTGLLTQVQRIGSGGLCPRTFGLDATGNVLITANAKPLWVKDGGTVRRESANLTTFKVHDDGRLERMHRYDVALPPGKAITWAGVAGY